MLIQTNQIVKTVDKLPKFLQWRHLWKIIQIKIQKRQAPTLYLELESENKEGHIELDPHQFSKFFVKRPDMQNQQIYRKTKSDQ